MFLVLVFCLFPSKIDDDHILRKLHPKSIWHLTVLGSLATTQREYVALHAFSRLNSQVAPALHFVELELLF